MQADNYCLFFFCPALEIRWLVALFSHAEELTLSHILPCLPLIHSRARAKFCPGCLGVLLTHRGWGALGALHGPMAGMAAPKQRLQRRTPDSNVSSSGHDAGGICYYSDNLEEIKSKIPLLALGLLEMWGQHLQQIRVLPIDPLPRFFADSSPHAAMVVLVFTARTSPLLRLRALTPRTQCFSPSSSPKHAAALSPKRKHPLGTLCQAQWGSGG